jgi:hypothetical protein
MDQQVFDFLKWLAEGGAAAVNAAVLSGFAAFLVWFLRVHLRQDREDRNRDQSFYHERLAEFYKHSDRQHEDQMRVQRQTARTQLALYFAQAEGVDINTAKLKAEQWLANGGGKEF